ncbi:PHB depolymerase family esterase [Aquincola sp. J276]|uniref:extracellular catalytic domain type 1 short-chain-length polyhydroxyalkanoate depolymerase n=1 Tax=Aquincola sp. J276 TaxID=2898432 RepID=UPI002150E1FE|nr:PHB depolymerase family esterase [Aquincola sp. J276]MCR5867202.1 prolyl oligopeptidase family serine peptidase [Aquincola sp. J276]
MAKRSLVASWARLFNRGSKVLAKAAVRQQKALLKPVKPARKAAAAQPKPLVPATPRVARPAVKARPAPLTRAGRIAKPALDAIAAQHRFPKARGDWLPGLAIGPAGTRRFTLYRPAALRGPPQGMAMGQPLAPAPLVVMLHGCAQNGRGLAISSRMHRLADRHGFFVLYPEQDTLAHPQGCWRWYELRSGHAQAEAQTLQLMLDQVGLRHAIDRTRVAVAGLSAGAGMAALMATREPLRYAAVVMHSGVAPGSGRSTATGLQAMRGGGSVALPPGVVLPPLMVLQGSADRVVDPANGRAAAEAWAQAAGARAGKPRNLQRGTRHAMTVTDYRRARRTMVRLVEIQGLGHAWSGGDAAQSYSDPAGPDASRLAWAFMQACFRRAA